MIQTVLDESSSPGPGGMVALGAGGILFGALGATLASPTIAVLLEAQKQTQAYRSDK